MDIRLRSFFAFILLTSALFCQTPFAQQRHESKPTLHEKFPGFKGRDFFVMGIAFSPDSEILAVGSGNDMRGVVELWNLKTKERIVRLEGHRGYVYSIAFSPDGKTLASSSFDDTVRLWEVATGKELHILKGHLRFAQCVVFSSDGKTVVSSDDENIYYWDAATGKKKATIKAHQGGTNALSFSPDGEILVSAGMDRAVKFWDVRTRSKKREPLVFTRSLQSIAFSHDGTHLAIMPMTSRTVSLYNLQSGQIRELSCGKALCEAIAYSPNEKTLAVSGRKDVLLYDVTSGKSICRFKAHEYSIYQIAFSPDGKFLATASSDNSAKLWNVEFLDDGRN